VWYPGNPLTNQIACLLRAGARVDVPDAEGETPLHRAARLASPEIFALLLQAADRAKRGTPLARALDAPDAAGRTPLFCAAESDRFALTNLALLLARGADPNVCTTGGVSLLHHVAAGPVRWPVPDAPLRVKLLLQRGANPNHPDPAGRTPLHALAAGEHPFTLTNAALLLAHGADPNARDRHGFTPLHFALTNRHWNVRRADLVNLLLQHRADPNATNASGQTPLILLAHAFLNRDFFQGAPEAARALLDAGADPAARDTNGQTFLHLLTEGAGGWGNIREIVADLLARHPDLAGLTNAAGDTLLHAAIRANNHMFVQLLLERGADVTRRNAAGESPLLLAARDWPRGYAWQVRPPGTTDTFWNTLLRRDFPQFEIWLRAEPRLAEVPFRDGQLPLAFAFKQRLTNFVNLLLELRAPLDPVSALYLGRTNELRAMLHQSNRIAPELLADAIRAGQFDAIQDLAAERGALQPANPCDQSLLRVALEHGRAAAADWLRARGVALTLHDAVELGDTNALRRSLLTNREALNQPCPHGRTLLGDAVRAKRAESAGALLALGADPNARENRGYTPLHLAAMWNTREIAQRLLEAGADVDARDEHSLTPLHHAARAGNTELAALLLQHGANVNTPTTRPPDDMVTMPAGATPLHWAAHAGRLDVVRLLLRHGANPALTNALGQTPLALVRTNAAAPQYRYGWVTFREPPPGDPARAQIARLLSR
jgi:ankyrin repeat protein